MIFRCSLSREHVPCLILSSSPAKTPKKNCMFCNADHNLAECSGFANLSDTKRHDFVMKQRLCFSCLRGGHQSRGCYKKKPCIHCTCDRKRATVMHFCTPEVFVGAESGEDRFQSNDNQSNTEQRSAYHICALTTMEGSFQETSLNNELFQGPDLTNDLVGVLIRFRQEPVAVMGDVQAMFYQVRVPKADQDLLRFRCLPQGDFTKELEEYRMTVHLFGAVSSPSCATFAKRRNAEDHKHVFSPDVVSTVMKNFYVDDCLKSLPSAGVAVKHVEELCI
ncbi:hypothetical protein ACROYT_G035182 [Oculina patagonica]